MNNPKISIIIPTYKPQTYIWECLDSLRNQTFAKDKFEVIIVLNGCGNPWKCQIEDYIANKMQGMNVNFIHTEQGGVSNARNLALDLVKGEYVTFIDDDDFVSPSYLEELYVKASPDTISLCYPYAFEDGKQMKQLKYEKTNVFEKYSQKKNIILNSKVRKFFSGPCMKLIPMSFIHERRYDVKFNIGEDALFMFLISDKIEKINFTSSRATYYRRFREFSALTSKRSRWNKVKNSLRMIKSYSTIYFSSPFTYSFIFYATRIMGSIKSMMC